MYLASDQPAQPNSWLGLGTAGTSFVTSSIVTPQSGVITGLTFSIRNNTLRDGDKVTATIYYSRCGYGTPVTTGIFAEINGPVNSTSPNCCVHVTGDFEFDDCILLSVLVTPSNGVGSLNNGAAATIIMSV